MEECTNVNGSGQTRTASEQKKLESWLPITASRKAKWWYSTFHNVTAMVGAGVLGLPFAIAQLGWVPGVLAIVLSWVVTFYSLWQLVEMHEMVPGRRFDRYFDLGEHVFGPKLGFWMVMPQQLTVQVASTIVYCVTGGKSLKKFFALLSSNMSDIRQTYYILVFVVLQLLLSQTPNFNTLKGVSLLAAVMSVCYSMVAFCTSIVKGTEHHPHHYGLRSHTLPGKIFDIFNALGTIAFAFAGHSVVLEIQATLPSTPEIPSKKLMWRGVMVAYTVVILCYLSVAISGFWAFGNYVEDDVLISLEHPNWLIAVANFMVFIHVIGSFQVFAMPVFDTIESNLVQKWNFNPSRTLRIIARSTYVVIVGFVAICIPFFGGLLGFFGGLAFASTSYIIPCILWIGAKKPKRWSFHWIASVFCSIVGILIATLAPIGGIRTIIVSAKTYKMFS
ncbi:PREDICTED: lysine histidine transporter-like 5 [Lupinus angustifolius]|uniref:lysine histidine transporter-like 5 n=1 Tax=Lupinus angustifolius TaxID=3871 RepID=UPI00092F423A|nr:PREDICTED: lysine histidine transporter-like 5 [Lupinus angustifolius]